MVLDILISLVGKIGESFIPPVGNQFGYLIYCNKKIENLKEQVEKLTDLRNGWERSIDEAVRNGEEIRPEVNSWMERVGSFVEEAREFLDDQMNLMRRCNGWFPNFLTRYRLGKEANQKVKAANSLQQEGKFSVISNKVPPSGIEGMSSKGFVMFGTRKLVMRKVMDAVKDDNFNFIGLHGMGGVGKTTLIVEIGKEVEKEKLFDKVVIAVVSQTVDLRKIQGQIADMLGYRFTGESDTGRASELRLRIKNGSKILIILDDVWTELDLADIGIPFGSDEKNCKIIITTRREQACLTMGMGSQTKIIHLDVLSKQEAWDLLRRNAGDVIESPTLNAAAKEIVKECRCLPIAVVTVGRAMRGKGPEDWKEAANELKISAPTTIEGVDRNVYKCLKLSYDHLTDEETKSCFLLCSLFPEDYNIPIETLVRYSEGLRIFNRVDTVRDARRRAHSIVNSLTASCLLMGGDEKGCIKMHDVVRDVALSIGSNKFFVRAGAGLKKWPREETLENYTGVSLIGNHIRELPDVGERPNFQILLLQDSRSVSTFSLFEGLKALKVLDLSFAPERISLEPLGCLVCLRTLILERMTVHDTTVLAQIKSLEILSFNRGKFMETPVAIKDLSNLRLLDLSDCEYLGDANWGLISPNMFSGLSRLEELYLHKTRTDLKYLEELKSLPELAVLTIWVKDTKYLPEDFVFPDLEYFAIHFNYTYFSEYTAMNYLELSDAIWWLRCVKALLRRTTVLLVHEFSNVANVVPTLSDEADGLNCLIELRISLCDELEFLFNTEEWATPGYLQQQKKALSRLETLELYELSAFRGICNGVLSTESLSELKNLRISSCGKLSNPIFPLHLLQMLQKLERLDIKYCYSLEQVFDFEDGEKGDNIQLLPSLREMELFRLPRLQDIWNFQGQHVHLQNLQVLRVYSCHRLKSVLHPSLAQSFVQLKELVVWWCNGLEEIVAKEARSHGEPDTADKVVFPSLKTLHLSDLPNLIGFSTGSSPFEFPSLEAVIVGECAKMETFTASSTTPLLKSVTIDRRTVMLESGDLNKAIQDHYKANEASTSPPA